MNTISWATPTTPLPMEINPRVVFERMFGRAGHAGAARSRACSEDRSILDSVADDLARSAAEPRRARPSAARRLPRQRPRDRAPHSARRRPQNASELTSIDAPIGVPESFDEHVALMFDLLAVAYQADITRVFTFMMAREASQRTYPQIGVTEPHHTISHHGNDPEKMAQERQDQHLPRAAVRASSSRSCAHARRRRLAARSLADLLRQRHGQRQRARDRSAAARLAVGGGVGKGHRHIQPRATDARRQPLGRRREQVRRAASTASARARAHSSCSR